MRRSRHAPVFREFRSWRRWRSQRVRCCWGFFLGTPISRSRDGTAATSFDIGTLLVTLASILAGGVLAILLGRWAGPVPLPTVLATAVEPARRIAAALAGPFERLDAMLRQWPAASLSLLALMVLLGAAMLSGR